jgi:hypothetical protein
MSVKYSKTRILTKRVPTVVDFTDNIQRWDSDNLYAQRADEVVKRSFTLKAVLDVEADFINGEGFADDVLGKCIINYSTRQGQTANALLKKFSKPYGRYDAAVLHIGYNLNYTISSIELKPIEHFRFGLPDKDGLVHKIYHCLNWERDARKGLSVDRLITPYDMFNPDPTVVAQQMLDAGGAYCYKGQILFFTEEEGQYPLATFDPVWEHAEAQARCATAKVAAIDNGFGGTVAIVYPGEFESAEEKAEFEAYIDSKSGPDGINSRIGIQDKSGTKKASDIFQQLQPVNVDKMWEYTENSASDAIMENYATPKELIGKRPETGMFNQENMVQAYTYKNARTRNKRTRVSELFAMLMQYFQTPIITEALIKEQQYTVNGVPVAGTPPAPGTPPTPAPAANSNIQNMTARQRQNFKRVLRDYTEKKTTRAQAEAELKGFGLTAEDIAVWLVDDEPQPTA